MVIMPRGTFDGIGGSTVSQERRHALEDRAHAEQREDTALTRRMAEAQSLGLHPSTVIGAGTTSHAIMPNNRQEKSPLATVAQMALMVALMKKGIPPSVSRRFLRSFT
jgi:ferric-dicitrate binding protein FerR (iron transport regulator)